VIVPTAFEMTQATTRTARRAFARDLEVETRSPHVDPVDLKPRSAASSTRGATLRRGRAGHEDPVALLPVPRRRATAEVERRLFVPDHVVGGTVEEATASARAVQDLPDAAAGLIRRAEIRRRLAQRAGDRLADLVRDLRAAGRVEEHEAALQRGEAAPHRLDVK
jgi:hypothetical protein